MKTQPTSTNSAEHYSWGSNCDGWHLVKNQSLSVIEEQIPPGASEVTHYHQRAQQFFFVLSGEAVMETEGCETPLTARQGWHILPGVRHRIKNISAEPVRFLVISQPPSHGDRVVLEVGNEPPSAGKTNEK
jgi:mannose-6-phosphate isomerase-like protein (cupin superfamily)